MHLIALGNNKGCIKSLCFSFFHCVTSFRPSPPAGGFRSLHKGTQLTFETTF